jgi:putative FmdB family regulatory protein
MPSYEYRCQSCRRRFDLFMSYTEYGNQAIRCPHCDSQDVVRRIGRIRFARSDESRMESMADPANLEGLDEDPRSLGRMMRQMSREVGEEMPPEFDEVVNRLEAGQSPEEIEKEVPDLGGIGDGDSGDAGFGGGMDDDF